jgi:hypothetical protein
MFVRVRSSLAAQNPIRLCDLACFFIGRSLLVAQNLIRVYELD